MLFISGRCYLSGTLVSVNVQFKVVLPQVEKVPSIVHVDVGTCHPSVCEIPVVSIRSALAHIPNIR